MKVKGRPVPKPDLFCFCLSDLKDFCAIAYTTVIEATFYFEQHLFAVHGEGQYL